ncbi:uncharacterized protein LOC113513602 [Galleria mellonella]|uniref:Uncharacterized protein LOC113513602 n=1 Tax=Galleria mellonella TaxID=7137 RepID=A0A6J1WNR5_GALME|nr:uncharacterized protein LOC113513602 [Galleria mellonella]XP_052759480.1 uncharacterized protein LOC113513602 [Galleria mellonella]
MAGGLPYTCYLILFTICIGQGDGHWKKKERKENLQHDIEAFRRMADKIEGEIEAFYDEYPDERLKGDNVDRIHYKYEQNTWSRNLVTKNRNKQERIKLDIQSATSEVPFPRFLKQRIANESEVNRHVIFTNDIDFVRTEPKSTDYNWPKFEDILMNMGKKYDWKNDRWIKVKEKLKESRMKKSKKDVDFHEKHKFNYRIVKLNRNKSRRNIVVAVSAVR